MTVIIAVCNQKGGVGKTTVTCGLAAAAAAAGRRVLVGDLDPQFNATSILGVEPSDSGTVAAMTNQPVEVQSSEWAGVDVMVSNSSLASVDMDGSHDVPFRLDDTFKAVDLAEYDVVLLDLPPSLGRLLAAGMVAADALILVTDPSVDGIKGISNVMETYELVRQRMNPRLVTLGVVVNRYRRTAEQQFREAELREAFGELVFPGHLPERAALPEAHAASMAINRHTTAGAREISTLLSDLWSEVERRADKTVPQKEAS